MLLLLNEGIFSSYHIVGVTYLLILSITNQHEKIYL